jgi:hypothetical protein
LAGTETLTNKTLSTGSTWNGNTIADTYIANDLTIAGGTIGTSAITLTQSASPTPVNEGLIEWDTDNDRIVVGTGSSQAIFYSGVGSGGVVSGTGNVSGNVTYWSGANEISGEAQLAISRGGTNSTDTPDAGAIVYGTGTAYAFNTIGTTGQALLSGGTGTPTWTTGTLALGGNFITSGASSLTLTTTNATNVTLPTTGTLATLAGTETLTNKTLSTGSTWNGNTIAVGYGGTGISSYTIGDIIFASGATTLAALNDVATGNVLISGGVATAPSWGKVSLSSHISGTLATANGGTGTDTSGSTGVPYITAGTWTVDATSLAITHGGTGVTSAGDLENLIEGYIFDADTETISGVWTLSDNVNLNIGTDGDFRLSYDETTDDRMEIYDSGGTNVMMALSDAGSVGNLYISGGISTYDSTVSAGYGEFSGLCLGNGTSCITSWAGAGSIDGSGDTGYVAYWTDANSLSGEATLATNRGGTNANSSAWNGLASITGGVWSSTGIASQGDILYYDGSAWTELVAGTADYFLQTKGAGANPVWAEANSLADGTVNNSILRWNSDTTIWTEETDLTIDTSGNLTTNGTIEGLTLTSAADGFTIAGGTTPRTLTVTSSDVTLNQSLSTTSAPTFATIDTGQGANELYDMDQNVLTTSAPTFATIDTGQGANELYDMDQNVLTTSSPTFAGLTVSGLTSGSIVFAGTSGVLSQDNTNFFWDDTNNRLGLGTNSPDSMLEIYGVNNQLKLSYDDTYYSTLATANDGSLNISTSNTAESAVIIGNGSAIDSSVQFNGNAQDYYLGLDDTDDALHIGLGQTVGTTPYITVLSSGYVGIGDTTPSFALDINGDAQIQGGELYLTGIASSASTTEGTIYYDTEDDNLYVYANGGWVDLTQQVLLTLTSAADGFTIAGGTTPRTLTVTSSDVTLNQSLSTTSAPTFATIDTGQGANELYDMDQDVLTTSAPTFDGLTLTGALTLNDDELFQIGTSADGVILNRSTSLTANTALTGVFVGTPVVSAIVANSTIFSNITSDADMVFAINDGGNSIELLRLTGATSMIDIGTGALVVDANSQVGIGISSSLTATLHLVNNEGAGAGNQGFLMHLDNDAFAGLSATAADNGGGLVITADQAGANTFDFLAAISDADGTDDTEFRLVGDGNAFADGSWSGSGADYAEYFHSRDTNLSPGETVCMDTARNMEIIRCSRERDNNVIGIISTNPAFIGNNITGAEGPLGDLDPNYKLVGLIGQVPARVTNENGKIKPGDALTPAKKSGYVMKAGAEDATVGVAMESFDQEDGTIKVLISRRNKTLTVEKVEQAVEERIAQMKIEDEVNLLLAGYDTRFSGMETVLGNQSALIKNLEEQISAINDQNQSVIDFALALNMDSLIYKDAEGNLDLGKGKLEADGIVAGAMTVKVVDEEKPTIGSNYIEPKDENNDGISYLVRTKAISDNSVVLTNFQANPNAYSWVEKVKDDDGDYIGFKIILSAEIQSRVYFDWWIVEKDEKENIPAEEISEEMIPIEENIPAEENVQEEEIAPTEEITEEIIPTEAQEIETTEL